jgi:hypothetical protein
MLKKEKWIHFSDKSDFTKVHIQNNFLAFVGYVNSLGFSSITSSDELTKTQLCCVSSSTFNKTNNIHYTMNILEITKFIVI